MIESAAKVQRDPDLAPLVAALEKDSHNEVIRIAALRGLADSTDPKAFDALLAWTKQGKPQSCRTTAVASHATFLKRNAADEKRTQLAVESLSEYLVGDTPRVRRAAATALRDLGSSAQPAATILRSLAEHDPDSRVRSLAETALGKIDSDTPAPTELSKLRAELEKLRKENETLEDRLQKLEAK
jgi:aminopeptidase N